MAQKPSDQPSPSPDYRPSTLSNLAMYLLALSIIPLLLYAALSQQQVKREQEAILHEAYQEQSARVLEVLDQKINDLRNVFVTLNQNYTLQNLAWKKLPLKAERDKKIQENIEPYLWYNTTRGSTVIKDFTIFLKNTDQPLGYFIEPMTKMPEFMVDVIREEPEFEGFVRDDEGELYYLYPLHSSYLHAPAGYYRARVDQDKVFRLSSVYEKGRTPSYGYAFSQNELELYRSVPATLSPPFIEVSQASSPNNIRLTFYIPEARLRVTIWPIAVGIGLALVIFSILLLQTLHQMRRYRNKIKKDQEELDNLRFYTLQKQMDPHFLYNTLSIINWKALYAGQDDISDITVKLSHFYRTALNNGEQISTLGKEVDMTETYIDLRKNLLDVPVRYSVILPDELKERRILHFLLQPLIENVLGHGIDAAKGEIRIVTECLLLDEADPQASGPTPQPSAGASPARERDEVLILICDNGTGLRDFQEVLADENEAFAVKNIDRRIQLKYGDRYGLSFFSNGSYWPLHEGMREEAFLHHERFLNYRKLNEEGGTLAVLYLPLEASGERPAPPRSE